ncbi:hypothetical protein COEREDRAFT_7984, partial [Coemansia reversa NRRL 1564]
MARGDNTTHQSPNINRAKRSANTQREANKENYVSHAENITPIRSRIARNKIDTNGPAIQMNLEDNQTPEDIGSSKTTPSKSRTSQAGAVQAYGTTENERDRERSRYTKYVLKNCAHRDVDEVFGIVSPTLGSRKAAAATESIEIIASAMEQLLAGNSPDADSGLPLE